MARYQSLSDIFERIKKLPKNADKAKVLTESKSLPLFYLIFLAFSDQVEWLLPEGTPPYKAWGDHPGGHRQMRTGSEPSDLMNEIRRMYIFLKGHPIAGPGGDHLSQLKREKLFQEVLEALPAQDVKLLLSIKDKTFNKDYRISRPLIEDTFPKFFEAPHRLTFGLHK
jgi:hypothetical protein